MQDMLGRQRRDDVELLGVEEDEEPGNPVGDRAGVVVEEPARVCPRRSWSSGPAAPVERDAGAVRRDAWRRATAHRTKFADRAR